MAAAFLAPITTVSNRKAIMRKALAATAAALISTTVLLVAGTAGATESAPGVTASTIKVGVTYPDIAAIKNLINVDPGDYQAAYKAVINQINAKGGINGRKIVPVFAAVDPLGTAGAATACTQLTEDDKVFLTMGFFQAPDVACYLDTHATPIIGVSLTAQQTAAAKAPWYNPQISDSELIPKEMAIFKQEGAFAGKKVGVVSTDADNDETAIVTPALKKLDVNVVQTAVNSVPDTDTTGQTQEMQTIAQKFQSDGVNVVVAVGNAGNDWPTALQDEQSKYTPRIIATDYNDLHAYTANKAGVTQAILKNVLTAGPTPPPNVEWNDPAMKSCVATIKKADPSDAISNPVTATSSTPVTYTAPETACQQVALLADILKGAGKTLTVSTFKKGAQTLTHVSIPGGGGTFNFSGTHYDGDGPVFVYTWSPSSNSLVLKTSQS
jgi:ABC-type branched-subunit amino acid transport system substrate-binding protein